MKTCNICKNTLPLDMFYKNSTKVDNVGTYCKPCHNDFVKERWRKLKLRAIELKGGKCQDCGGLFHRAVYQFHHLDPKKKDADWHHLKRRSWERIVLELEKCVLLCANCHFIRHALEE